MVTVRFPNGQAVQYNTAAFVVRSSEYSDIYENSSQKVWIAQVPNTCIIEIQPACRVYDGMNQRKNDLLRDEVKNITKELRSIKRKLNKKL